VLPTELLAAGVDLRSLQPLAGRFAAEGYALCFLPRFPFVEGTSYTLLYDPAPDEASADGRELWSILRTPRNEAPATHVVAIYPSGGGIPVNLLKLYVQFSGPMSEGWAARAVHVRRASDGAPLEGVFLASTTELWDRSRRRLTLLLDPGRIKRGLVPNAEAGYPLSEGVPIVVEVDPAFRDAAGRPLPAGMERRYRVGPLVRTRIESRAWRFVQPRAGTTEPLQVTFDRPLDRALLDRCLWVHEAAGTPLEGRAAVGECERSWRFEPLERWRDDRYALVIESQLEDLAGNSLARVFDRDLTRVEDEPAAPGVVVMPFGCAS
jgi:hypothetical protein